MKESYIEGLATHDDPESCAHVREGQGEALTGARAGRVLSREMQFWDADAVNRSGRQHSHPRYCERVGSPARSETPCTYGTYLRENREICASLGEEVSTGRAGKAKAGSQQ